MHISKKIQDYFNSLREEKLESLFEQNLIRKQKLKKKYEIISNISNKIKKNKNPSKLNEKITIITSYNID